MKTDRAAMHRRAQRAEADRDRAAGQARHWEARWRLITGQRRDARERVASEAIAAFSRRASGRMTQCVCLVLAFAAFLLLTACAHATEAVVRTVEIKVPVAVACAKDPGAEPTYADSPAAMRAAADIFERTRLVLAGRAQREARLAELKAASAGCF